MDISVNHNFLETFLNKLLGTSCFPFYPHICKSNSWARFHQQKRTFGGIKFQNALSQRVFIISWDEKCMSESKHESFKKWTKFWSWTTSFWSFVNFRKYAIYMFYIHFKGLYWVLKLPNFKKLFSDNLLVYMLYIWHSGRIMKPARKWYFWLFLCPKIAFFVSFAQISPKNMKIWAVGITFFAFVVSQD